MYVMRRETYRGFGDSQQAAQITGAAIGASTPAVAAIAAPSVAGILGMTTAVAVPVIGAAVAGVALLATYLIRNSGCGQTCIETSAWANQAADVLDKNIAEYFSVSPRTKSWQAQHLATFDAIWARLVEMCSDPSTGNAGKRCISDRQAGACVWKQTADAVPPWGTPRVGECWNWHNGYRDPIANDADVVPDSSLLSTGAADLVASAGSALSAGGWGGIALLALVGLGVWAVAS